MGVEVKPFGVRCNIQCQYCYQNPERDAGNIASSYDLDRIISAIEGYGREFSLFGGEALMMPEADLEKLFAYGLERFGSNSLQTNGTLINDNHIRLFKKYDVAVGLSLDGPGELNDVRWAGTLEKTREATAKIEANIDLLCREGLVPTIIITLHRGNATAEKLPRMIEWCARLRDVGVKHVRLHILEVDDPAVRAKYALSDEENVAAFGAFLEAEPKLKPLRFDVFRDMRRMLEGDDSSTTCVWNACDPYTTDAVQGVGGTGQRSNCDRTNKDGIDFAKSDRPSFERYVMLYHTPQEHGGCAGCRFFLMCKGQCPGTAAKGDWRNRTEHCGVWMGMYERLEKEMTAAGKAPLSLSPHRKALEEVFIRAWLTGSNPHMCDELPKLTGEPSARARKSARAGKRGRASKQARAAGRN